MNQDSNYSSIIERYDVTTLLCSSLLEICRHLSMTETEARRFISWATRRVYDCSKKIFIADLIEIQREMLSFGDKNIDEFFQGGIPTRVITDVSGVGGSGKGQLCLQLCVMATLGSECGGLDSSVIVIAIARAFNVTKLKNISEHLYGKFGRRDHAKALNRISIINIFDVESLEHIVRYQIPEAVKRLRCRLIVVSGIASVFRYHDEDEFNRSETLHNIGLSLKKTAYENGAAVICINQAGTIVDGIDGESNIHKTLQRINDSRVSINPDAVLSASELHRNFLSAHNDIPALGLLWEDLTTIKVLCVRNTPFIDGDSERLLLIVSPYHDPEAKFRFEISDIGVIGFSSR